MSEGMLNIGEPQRHGPFWYCVVFDGGTVLCHCIDSTARAVRRRAVRKLEELLEERRESDA